jgi:hypothetical protein
MQVLSVIYGPPLFSWQRRAQERIHDRENMLVLIEKKYTTSVISFRSLRISPHSCRREGSRFVVHERTRILMMDSPSLVSSRIKNPIIAQCEAPEAFACHGLRRLPNFAISCTLYSLLAPLTARLNFEESVLQ